ncbi:Cloroperoxidase [Auriscalpium vulgare]|uniref:Cloroperoxidase n=1 Tax=Auriscalpium vulgare TaxID=40419 RepID=A0ACB8SBE9_9AGAM|nr:Cloroperoxidase [Auriscalpium vulgare]
MSNVTEPAASHPFVPAAEGESRSPCPALNALANHGYLPHNGRNITAPQLIRALRQVYHVSLPFATLLSLGGTVWCGSGWRLDLEDLAKHDHIEHNASLTHADAPEGNIYAPIPVDKELLQDMLDTSETDYLTFDDLVKTRVQRDQTLVEPLNNTHTTISRGEVVLTVEALGDEEGRVPKDYIRQWFGEERLPEGWQRPKKTIGLLTTNKGVKQVGARGELFADAKKMD